MIILGEKLNSSIPSTLKALQQKDELTLTALCKSQEAAGAHYLDINTAICGDDELTSMLYLIQLAQEHTQCGIMIDTPNVEVARQAIQTVKDRPIILNSITVDERHELIELAKEYNAGLVALPISENGIPEFAEERLDNAKALVKLITAQRVSEDKIYLDVIIESLAVNGNSALNAIETARLIKSEFPDVHMTCGLSNISFGLPKRANINTALIPALMCAGVDSAILDITSERTRSAVISSRALCGLDEYCMEYIEEFR